MQRLQRGLSITFVIFPDQTGTATSSPTNGTPSPTDRGFGNLTQQATVTEVSTPRTPLNIVNVMLWMKRNAYADSTIAKVAKLLRHLRKNCNTSEPEEVKMYVSKKNCSIAHKENLIEAYSCYMKSENLQFYILNIEGQRR